MRNERVIFIWKRSDRKVCLNLVGLLDFAYPGRDSQSAMGKAATLIDVGRIIQSCAVHPTATGETSVLPFHKIIIS